MDWLQIIAWSDVAWTLGLFLLGSVVSIAIVVFIVVRMPVRFIESKRQKALPQGAGQIAKVVGRNLAGLLVLATGVVMIFTPGQGVLLIFVGLLLIDFPGKRKLILSMLRRPKLLASLNYIRAKFHKPPLEAPVGFAPAKVKRTPGAAA